MRSPSRCSASFQSGASAALFVKTRPMYSPSLEEFSKLALQGNLIPVARRLLADFETPLSAYCKSHGQGESFLFESVEGGEHLGRSSVVRRNPRTIIRQTAHRIDVL